MLRIFYKNNFDGLESENLDVEMLVLAEYLSDTLDLSLRDGVCAAHEKKWGEFVELTNQSTNHHDSGIVAALIGSASVTASLGLGAAKFLGSEVDMPLALAISTTVITGLSVHKSGIDYDRIRNHVLEASRRFQIAT